MMTRGGEIDASSVEVLSSVRARCELGASSVEHDWAHEERGECAPIRGRVLEEDAVARAVFGMVLERIEGACAQGRQGSRPQAGFLLELLAEGLDVPACNAGGG